MATPHRMPLMMLGWQSWSIIVVVLALTTALLLLFIAAA